jgi:CheB methylesterase
MKRADFPVVALVCSAGGLAALTRVLAPLPADFPAALLVLQHHRPESTSGLGTILARTTMLPVTTAREGDALVPAHVLVAPLRAAHPDPPTGRRRAHRVRAGTTVSTVGRSAADHPGAGRRLPGNRGHLVRPWDRRGDRRHRHPPFRWRGHRQRRGIVHGVFHVARHDRPRRDHRLRRRPG